MKYEILFIPEILGHNSVF